MQKNVELQCNGLTLRGELHIPDGGKGKYPFVAMFHGFTGTKTEAGFKFVQLSRKLESRGIGSVRFDFSGSGESDGTFDRMSVKTELEEAKLIYKFMSGIDCADEDNLFILGFSMGGLVSSLAAPALEKLKGMVLWAPAGSMYDYVKNIVQSCAEQGKDRPECDGVYINMNLVDDLQEVNVFDIAKDYSGDVLLIHGSGDNAVSFEESLKYSCAYGGKAEFLRIEGADHLFSKVEWTNELLDGTVDFIMKRTAL